MRPKGNFYQTHMACGTPIGKPHFVPASFTDAIFAKAGDKLPRGWRWQRRGNKIRAFKKDGKCTGEWLTLNAP